MKAPQVSAGAGRHSLQPQPATCSSPTHRQPWKPPRTRLSCSSLQHKGCEQQGNPSRLQLRPAWVTPGMKPSRQKSQQGIKPSRQRVGPGSCISPRQQMGVGSTSLTLQAVCGVRGVCCRVLQSITWLYCRARQGTCCRVHAAGHRRANITGYDYRLHVAGCSVPYIAENCRASHGMCCRALQGTQQAQSSPAPPWDPALPGSREHLVARGGLAGPGGGQRCQSPAPSPDRGPAAPLSPRSP